MSGRSLGSASRRPRRLGELWADNQNWTDPDFRQPPEVRQRLQDVYALFRSGDLYKLDNPAAEHDWGWVVGIKNFHEFVLVDRSKHQSRISSWAFGAVQGVNSSG